MPLVISDEMLQAAGLNEQDAKIEIACRWFDAGKLTIGNAARLAGLSETQFESQLDLRGLPRYRYTADMLENDVSVLKNLGRWGVPLIVVSDCSPSALHHLSLLSLCPNLYESVVVPEAVEAELRQATTTCVAFEISDYPGFDVRRPHATAQSLAVPSDLDPGETEAITLAIELHADLLLMDERKGTEAAKHLGLQTIGVFGILLEAKRRGLIPDVLPLLDRLVKGLRFFVSPPLRQRIAQLAGE